MAAPEDAEFRQPGHQLLGVGLGAVPLACGGRISRSQKSRTVRRSASSSWSPVAPGTAGRGADASEGADEGRSWPPARPPRPRLDGGPRRGDVTARRRTTMPQFLRGLLWIQLYVLVSVAPLGFALLGQTPPGRDFLTELSVALGFVGLSMLGLQFAITARFGSVAAPYGMDVVIRFHRLISLVAFTFVLAHPLLLFVTDPRHPALLRFWDAPWRARFGLASIVALIALVVTSVYRTRLGLRYEVWKLAHGILGVVVVATALRARPARRPLRRQRLQAGAVGGDVGGVGRGARLGPDRQAHPAVASPVGDRRGRARAGRRLDRRAATARPRRPACAAGPVRLADRRRHPVQCRGAPVLAVVVHRARRRPRAVHDQGAGRLERRDRRPRSRARAPTSTGRTASSPPTVTRRPASCSSPAGSGSPPSSASCRRWPIATTVVRSRWCTPRRPSTS